MSLPDLVAEAMAVLSLRSLKPAWRIGEARRRVAERRMNFFMGRKLVGREGEVKEGRAGWIFEIGNLDFGILGFWDGGLTGAGGVA